MRLLLCLDEGGTERVLTATLDVVRIGGAQVRLVHVLDVGAIEQAGHWRERYLGRGGMGGDWRARLDAATQARGEEILRAAEARLTELLRAGGLGAPGQIERSLLAGRPEQEIVRVAAEWPATLVALGARRQDGAPPPPGPRSVGHVARFVTDHAPCPVLLARP
jgi:nucleotide-binding universal stress UspA family protein